MLQVLTSTDLEPRDRRVSLEVVLFQSPHAVDTAIVVPWKERPVDLGVFKKMFITVNTLEIFSSSS